MSSHIKISWRSRWKSRFLFVPSFSVIKEISTLSFFAHVDKVSNLKDFKSVDSSLKFSMKLRSHKQISKFAENISPSIKGKEGVGNFRHEITQKFWMFYVVNKAFYISNKTFFFSFLSNNMSEWCEFEFEISLEAYRKSKKLKAKKFRMKFF